MSNRDSADANRREFLSGRALHKMARNEGDKLADELSAGQPRQPPSAEATVRLATRSMNCEFSVLLNPSHDRKQLMTASDALEMVHPIETELTIYRPTSTLLEINRIASQQPVTVDEQLFELLQRSVTIAEQTAGAFNPLAGKLNQLWRSARSAGTVPDAELVDQAVQAARYQDVQFCDQTEQISFASSGPAFDLGGMGKGYALDRIAEFLEQEQLTDFLIHGGHSSILARGQHAGQGWSVGIRDPLAPHKRLATLLLSDCSFSASGSGTQFFRHRGKRYGHIFDPRTGWPVEHMLSVAVVAPLAAHADAYSTALSVMSLEQSYSFCEQHPEVGVLLCPTPPAGKRLKPIVINIPDDQLFWTVPG